MSDFFAKICTNGHAIVERTPLDITEYCEICGAKLISKCPNCNSPIKEWHINAAVFYTPDFKKPLYCRSCGKPYPWTASAIQSAEQLILEEEALTESTKTAAVASLPDIISETPNTNLAVVRIKKVLSSAGKFTSDAVRQFVIDFGCELAIKLLTS